MRKQLLALVLACCCYCSYSFADGGYTQQYQVGDTGPNDGTITAVTVNSVLSDTTVEIIGDFQETTETWNHTETLTEVRTDSVTTTELVATITEVTTQVITEVQTPVETTTTTEVTTETTTDNLAPDISTTDYSKSGKVYIGPNAPCSHSGGAQQGEACFGSANAGGSYAGGGTITSNKFDIDTDMTEKELQAGFDIDYGIKVESHTSNTSVPLCENTNGDCKDKFTMTVNLYKSDNSLINSYSHSVILDYSGTRSFSWDQTIGANAYELGVQAEFVIFGVDAGYPSGYYGPIVSDPWLTVTYDVISYITETITTYVTEQVISYVTEQVTTYEEVTTTTQVDRTFTTELTDETTVLTSEYIGNPVSDIPTDEPISIEEEFTVEIEDMDGNVIAEFSVDVVEVEAGVVEVQVESTNSTTGMPEIETVATIETIQEIESFDTGIDSSLDTGTVDMEISVDSVDSVADLAEVVDIEPNVDSGSEVNTSIEDTSTDATDTGENTGSTGSAQEGNTAELESNTSESNDSGSEQSTSESGDGGDEGQESEDIQTSETESNETETEGVQESSGNVEESVEDSGGSDSESKGQDGDSNEKGSNKSGSETKTKVASKSPAEVKKATKQAITKKILQQISIAANQTFAAGENLRLVLLATQGDTTSFKNYQTKLPQQSTDWYVDNGIYNDVKQIKDPYAVLFSLAQDKKHNEMVEEQYRD